VDYWQVVGMLQGPLVIISLISFNQHPIIPEVYVLHPDPPSPILTRVLSSYNQGSQLSGLPCVLAGLPRYQGKMRQENTVRPGH